jgi:hypothetical protein
VSRASDRSSEHPLLRPLDIDFDEHRDKVFAQRSVEALDAYCDLLEIFLLHS